MRDTQRVEFAHEANAQVGTFVVEVFTKLKETLVSHQFSATPEDDRVLEKTKRRICCSAARDEADVDVTSVDPGPGPSSSSLRAGASSSKQVTRFDTPQAGLKESGRPAATIKVSFKVSRLNLMDMIDIFRLATMMCLVQDPDITETKCSVLTVYGKFLTNIFHFQSEA